jgi:nicotinamide phosphoribosyltransferase
MNPLLLVDYYKTEHFKMYPSGMTKLYSNLTPRKSRMSGVDKVVTFGIQHFALTYLIEKFNEDFFKVKQRKSYELSGFDAKPLRDEMIREYSRHIKLDDYSHIEKLWDLGYLPIEIKALAEGTLCPIGVPMLTITNTHSEFAWLVNYLETLMSCMLWQPITSATIAHEYKKLLSKYAIETTGSADFVQWQGHDFSMRGMSSSESAILSGMGHLTSFTGTDTIPAIYQLESSYKADGLIGASVPATEHSVMCMGTKEDEIATFKRLLDSYPKGILSVVSDTWDLWKVCTEYLPKLKEEILKRDGKLVIRPDSGDPVDIICGARWNEGYLSTFKDDYKAFKESPQGKGVIELLWETFGGTINEQGYKVLDSHIGAIYGDSITLDRAQQICERLKAKGFASTNIVLGIGSYTYQYNTRDTFGFAIKATYGEVIIDAEDNGTIGMRLEAREIFKDPITDDGTKRSKKGLLSIPNTLKDGKIWVKDQCTWEEEGKGLLQTVFKDGQLVKQTTLTEIRERLNKQL